MTDINEFNLQEEIYLYQDNYLVKIYTPSLYLEDKIMFWIYYLATKQVNLVDSKQVKLAPKNYQILYRTN
jgi:hypothetical protein